MVDEEQSPFNWRTPLDWTKLSGGHLVQIYDNDGYFAQSVGSFLSVAFKQNEAAILICTPEHREMLEHWLKADGVDPVEAQRSGRYIPLDARETLKQFMMDGMPDKARFFEVLGGVVSRAETSWNKVRAFGEMVALLCEDGNLEGAIALEELWNQLAKLYLFTLLCAYRKSAFSPETAAHAFSRVCMAHCTVIL